MSLAQAPLSFSLPLTLLGNSRQFRGTDPATIPFTIRGAAAQTADLFVVENSAGTDMLRVDPDGNLTIAGTANITIDEAITGDLTLTGNLVVNGNTTLGDAAGDTLTVTATPTFAQIVTMSGALNVTGITTTQSLVSTTRLGLRRRGATPAPIGVQGQLYTRAGDADTTELFYLDPAGNDVQITDAGALEGASLFWDDDEFIRMGNTAASPNVRIGWETADANANALIFVMPEGDGTDVPVAVFGDANALNADLGLFDGITSPAVAVLSDDILSYVYMAHNQTDPIFRTNEGSFDYNALIQFSTGQAITAGDYQIGRDADGTNQLHLNVPTGAGFEMSVNDVSRLTLTAADLTSNPTTGISWTTAQITSQANFIAYTMQNVSSGAATHWEYTGGTHTDRTASTEIIDFHINGTNALQHLTGNYALQRMVVITPRTYTFVAASTVDVATTLAIVSNVIAGTNATISEARTFSIGAAAGGAGTTTGTVGMAVANQSLAGSTTSFAVSIASQTANATTTRAVELAGTGVNNAIRLGASANLYGSAAETVRLSDSTDVNGLSFVFAATANQTINTITATTGSIVFQNQTFTAGVAHNAVTITPTWVAENFGHTALRIAPTQNGANSDSFVGLNVLMTKATGATVLDAMVGINIQAPSVAGTVSTGVGIDIADQTNAGFTSVAAIRTVGTGTSNAFSWGNSARQYGGGASDISFMDATNVRGVTLTLAAAGDQTLQATGGNLALTATAGNDVLIGDNATLLYVDGGVNGGIGGVGIGQIAQNGSMLVAGWNAYTMAGGTTAARHFYTQGNVTELAGAAITDIVGAYFNTFTVTDGGGAETVGILATVYIPNAPTAGTAPTNGPFALFVDAGATRLDGTLTASGGGALTGTWTDMGAVTTIDINGGTIDGVTIGGAAAGAITGTTITGTSFVIGANTLTTTEWAFLDGQNQSVFTTSSPTFVNLTITSFAANWTNAGRTVADLGVVTTVDINGGTIDGVTIGGAAAGDITGNTITANTNVVPDADNGAGLGISGTAFADLFLASGAVINFSAADVTLTHAAGQVTLAGDMLFSNDARLTGNSILGFGTDTELTLDAGGAIVPTRSYHNVDTNADGASDDLDTITATNFSTGDILILRANNDGRTVVVRHQGGGTGNIRTNGQISFSMDNTNDKIVLLYDGTNFVQIGVGNNGS